MKTKLLFSLSLILASFISNAQCTSTQTVGLVVSTTTVIPFSAPFTVKICATGIGYDTTGNSGRIYFLESGSKLYLKMHSTTPVYMKSGSTLNVLGNGTTIVYAESNTTITGVSAGMITTCSVVTFPSSPSCVATKINEYNSDLLNSVAFYPNPAKNNLILTNESAATLDVQLTNVLGQKVRSFTIENGKNNIDISDLNEGIYFVSIIKNNEIVSTKKLIITK
jgi:hypothetical protein